MGAVRRAERHCYFSLGVFQWYQHFQPKLYFFKRDHVKSNALFSTYQWIYFVLFPSPPYFHPCPMFFQEEKMSRVRHMPMAGASRACRWAGCPSRRSRPGDPDAGGCHHGTRMTVRVTGMGGVHQTVPVWMRGGMPLRASASFQNSLGNKQTTTGSEGARRSTLAGPLHAHLPEGSCRRHEPMKAVLRDFQFLL